MRLRALLALAVVLVAGCSEAPPPPAAADGAGTAIAAEPGVEDTVVLLSETYRYALDQDISPALFTAPPGADHLRAGFETHAEAACSVVAGKPTSPLDASITFTSPSGVSTRVEAGGYPCEGPVVSTTMGGWVRLDPEPGDWTVTFEGRGQGATVRLVVTAEPAEVDVESGGVGAV